MKTAKLYTHAIEIHCPHCNQPQPNANGSRSFTAKEVTPGQVLTCQVVPCHKQFRLPTSLRAEAREETK